MPAVVEDPPVRPTSEIRREQLLEVAARIIETEGVDALRPTRVAALAGCTRPLIYQYFPRREDFFIALTEDLYRTIDGVWTPEKQAEIIPAAYRGDDGPIRAFLARLWDYIDEHGPASLILRATPELSRAYNAYLAHIRDAYEQRWLQSFAELGMAEDQAELMLEAFIVITKVLGMQLVTGRIDRRTAIHRHVAAIGGLLSGSVPAAST